MSTTMITTSQEGSQATKIFDINGGGFAPVLHYRKHILAAMDRMSVEHRDADSREKYSIGFWGKYADNCFIHKEGDIDLHYTGNNPRLDNIQLEDKIHNSRSLQEQFMYDEKDCYSDYVPSPAGPGHPEVLEGLTLYGVRTSYRDAALIRMQDSMENFPYKLLPTAMQFMAKTMSDASASQLPDMIIDDDVLSPIRVYQEIMASLCRNVWLQSVKINRDYTQLLAKVFTSRADVINYIPQAEIILKLQEISKRVKAGTYDSEVINTIIDNQISTEGMDLLSESEKSRIRGLYNRVQARRGDIPIASFWVQLRDCFDQSSAATVKPQTAMRASIPLESSLQHALAAYFEKQSGKFDSTYDRRTPLVGKAGPPRKKDEQPQDSSSDDLLPATRKQVRDLFSILGQVAKGQRDQERENRGQPTGRQQNSGKQRGNWRQNND